MTEHQAFLLKMLKEIDAICRKHDIKYFLAGGTLIGALRHGGFLPWDDDLDLYMPRPDWIRFVYACKTDLPPHRALQSPELDIRYHNTFSRYVSTDTTAIHAHQILDDSPAGMVVDILILDSLPNDPEILKKYTYDYMLYADLLNYSLQCGRRFGVTARDYRKYLRLQKRKGPGYVRALFEKRIASYFDVNGSVYVMRWGGNLLVFERSWFQDTLNRRFEDFEALIPWGANEYLVYHYGDEWAEIPLHTERASHDMAASLALPANRFRNEKSVDETKQRRLMRMMERRKKILLKIKDFDLGISTQAIENQALCQKMDLMAKVKASELNIAGIPLSEDLQPYQELFSSYLSWQLDTRAIGRDDFSGVYRFNHPVLSSINNELFYAACYLLFASGLISKAKRLLEIRKAQRGLSSALTGLDTSIDVYRQATNLLWHQNYAEAQKLIIQLRRQYPTNISILKLQCAVYSATLHASKEKLLVLLKYACNRYPNDGDFLKYLGDLLLALGDTGNAYRIYQVASEKTRNGLNLFDIYKKSGIFSPILSGAAPRTNTSKTQDVRPSFYSDKQACFFRLFSELCDLCNQNQIPYIVHPEMALWISRCQKLPANHNAYSIIIHQRESSRVLRAFEKMALPHRSIKYMGNSPYTQGFYMRYIDSSTTRVPIDLNLRHQPLGFSIKILLVEPREIPKLWQALVEGREKGYARMSGSNTLKTMLIASMAHGYMRLGKKAGEYLFSKWRKASSKQNGGKVRLDKQLYELPSWLFDHTQWLEINGQTISAPYDLETYFITCFGANYQSHLEAGNSKGSAINYSNKLIEGPHVPYRCFLEQLGEHKKYRRQWQLNRFFKAYPAYALHKFRSTFKDIKQTVAVEDIAVRYNRQLGDIIQLYRDSEMDTLAVLFEDFARVAEYYPADKGFKMERELFYIFSEVMAKTDRIEETKLQQLWENLRES